MQSNERFTSTGDRELEAKIDRMLVEIARAAERVPGVDSVLLGGSLARGEASVDLGPEGWRLISDVEIYIVGLSGRLRQEADTLTRELSGLTGADITVAWLSPERLRRGWAKNLSRRTSHTIHNYELYTSARLLAGRKPSIAPIDPRELPVEEGVTLLLNRLAEAAPHIALGSAQASRWLDKILMAVGDTLLLAKKQYTALYRDRATRIQSLPDPPWVLDVGWRDIIASAYARKVGGRIGGADAAVVAELIAAVLRQSVRDTLGAVEDSWSGFPERFVGLASRNQNFLSYLPWFGPASVYEGVVLLGRLLRSGRRLSVRAAQEALAGRPVSLWLRGTAAPLFFGIVGDRSDLIVTSADTLVRAGIPRDAVRSAALNPVSLSTLLVSYWKHAA